MKGYIIHYKSQFLLWQAATQGQPQLDIFPKPFAVCGFQVPERWDSKITPSLYRLAIFGIFVDTKIK
jgi:hypothetical protein